MMIRVYAILLALAAMAGLALLAGNDLQAQGDAGFTDTQATRAALNRAQNQATEAEARGRKLEAQARDATQAVEKTAREAAALAARVQQAEAGIDAAQARLRLIAEQRAQLDRRLAVRQQPLIRLTGALQKMARRPLTLSALRPGSLKDAIYLRAMLETTIPQVRRRTVSLRGEITRGQMLQREAEQAVTALRTSETELTQRRKALAILESRQRLDARRTGGDADRESERALALAEEARDLDTLVQQLDQAGDLRAELAALDGPVIRPDRPGRAAVTSASGNPPAGTATGAPQGLQLPVTGRTVSGFGEAGSSGLSNTGLSLAPRNGAQIIAPAAGRVAFAGPYRGFDRIVILEHAGGWTSLITGLSRADVDVGETLVGGAPLGIAGIKRPVVTFELRRSGKPVNPVDFIG